MASFIGNSKDFNRFIGPMIRNLVQKITKKHKQNIGCCEECGAVGQELDAAHIHGLGRKEIIENITNNFSHQGIITIDLDIFEEKFIENHDPIEKVIRILCKSCHRKYDEKLKPQAKTSSQEELINPKVHVARDQESEINRVHDKVPRWFKNPSNMNSRILIAFLGLVQKNEVVLYPMLEACFLDEKKKFKGHFNCMKAIYERNHAKVFSESDGVITLWKPVSGFILNEYKKYQLED